MGKTIEALLHLQSTQLQLVHVQRRLASQKNAVTAQERKINQLRDDWEQLHDKRLHRRTEADRLELELKTREEHVAKLRAALNTAKTNKEYAAILTQINTAKADNAKFEDEALRLMQEVDTISADADKIKAMIDEQEAQLEDIRRTSAEQIEKLTVMAEQISAQRTQAANAVPHQILTVFERIANSYDGEAMAPIEIHGKKAPYEYICGGCFMSLNAEHVNALRVRDEIRTCDNCRRILYLAAAPEKSRT